MAGEILSSVPGVYAITNSVNGKRYVGSSSNMRKRQHEHLHNLRNGTHHSAALLGAWKKHGEDAFSFVELEIVADASRLIESEQKWIDLMGAVSPGGYNIRCKAESNLGAKMSAEFRERMRIVATGRKHSEDTRRKMSASRMGAVFTEERRAKISAALAGKKRAPLSEETRDALSATLTGRPKSNEYRIRFSRLKAVLSEDAVRDIRRRYLQGERNVDIAEFHGVHKDVVSNICRGKSYRHVT